MENLLSSNEMRSCDKRAVEEYSIPSLLLMENAGRSVVDAIEKHFGNVSGKSFLIFCGKGNNGGDGFVVARHLFNRGANVHVLLVGKKSEVKGDAKTNLEIVLQLQKKTKNTSQFSFSEIKTSFLKDCPRCDIIIDALFGTRFSGEVRKPFAEIVGWMNASNKPIVAIDIPSGINSDNGMKTNVAVKANLTVTMAARKIGLIVNDGKECLGIIEVADISIPKKLLEEKRNTFLVEKNDVSTFLPKRALNVNKYSVGKVFVLAGSRQFPGAGVMTATSAMKSGVGAVILGTIKSLYPLLVKKLTEVMLEPLDETSEGTISLSSKEKILERIAWCDTLAIGPGISQNEETQRLVREIISSCEKLMVIDADALRGLEVGGWRLGENKISPTNPKPQTPNHFILTPHTGELSRMIGISSEEIETNRVEIARSAAKKFNSVLVLKGNPTVIATPGGNVFLNSTGNPGMATAGSGDVLTGTIAGILAQMKSENIQVEEKLQRASIAGVYIHGLAGDVAKEKFGERSLMAMDISDSLSFALQSLTTGERTNQQTN
ncbi:MAG: NAD(P)H-hydrate dehydratase [Ignavibacteriales bacterium]|nr:NAD(P)H-hydrate dehydratase [Ignavibacteriales bacterium]